MQKITYLGTWSLAWPIILSNITIPLVGAVDTAVIGQLPGAHYIAAVALGAVVFDFLFWGFNFLKIGTSGLTAQAIGADNLAKAGLHIAKALVIAVIAAILVLSLQRPMIQLVLATYQTEAEVALAVEQYFNIRIWGCLAVFINFVLLGSFIALQKTRFIFFHQLLLNLSNIILNLIFVLLFDMQVQGVALATVIANFTAMTFGLRWLYIINNEYQINVSISQALKQKLSTYLALMKLNADIMIRTACLVFSFAFMAYHGSKLGTAFLAANAILLHFQSIMAYGLDGFADTTESLAGRAYGRCSDDRLKQALKVTTVLATFTALICTITYFFWGKTIIKIFTIDEQIISLAIQFLPWIIISPLVSVWSFQLDGLFNGVTHTAQMRNAMLASTSVFVITSLVLVNYWHNHGLWLSFLIFMLARAITLSLAVPGIIISIKEAQQQAN